MNKVQPTTFYIVRHGETDWNVAKRIQGQTDIPMNKNGEKQVKELAKKFKSIKFDLAFSSDLMRAKKTAEIIALEHKLVIGTTKLLRERDFGKFEGEPSELFFTHLKLLKAMQHEERFKHKIGDTAESDEKFSSRVITFLRETAVAYPGKTILVGAHGGVFHVLLVHLGMIDYTDSDQSRFKNTEYIKIRTDGVDIFVDEVEGKVNLLSNHL